MTIILDLDHTLINTTLLKIKIAAAVEKYGVNQEMFSKTYEATVTRYDDRYGYDAGAHGQKIAEVLGKPHLAQEIAQTIYNALTNTEHLVYEDVIEFLKTAKGAGGNILLLSRGDNAWQQAKIEAAKIKPYIDRAIVASASKGEALRTQIRPDDETYFVNDNAQEIAILREVAPKLKYIQLIRPEGKYREAAKDVPVCQTLNEVWQKINDQPQA